MNGLRCYKPHKQKPDTAAEAPTQEGGGESHFPNDRLGIKTVVSRAAVCQ